MRSSLYHRVIGSLVGRLYLRVQNRAGMVNLRFSGLGGVWDGPVIGTEEFKVLLDFSGRSRRWVLRDGSGGRILVESRRTEGGLLEWRTKVGGLWEYLIGLEVEFC